MSFFSDIMNKISPKDDDGYIDDGYEFGDDDSEDMDELPKKENGRRGLFSSHKVIDGAPQGMQVISIKPAGMEDARVICDSLLDGKAVILNMEGIGTELAQRIIDFTLGSIYAIQGNLQQITRYIFVASPMNVELTGDFIDDFSGKSSTGPAPKRANGNGGFTMNA